MKTDQSSQMSWLISVLTWLIYNIVGYCHGAAYFSLPFSLQVDRMGSDQTGCQSYSPWTRRIMAQEQHFVIFHLEESPKISIRPVW